MRQNEIQPLTYVKNTAHTEREQLRLKINELIEAFNDFDQTYVDTVSVEDIGGYKTFLNTVQIKMASPQISLRSTQSKDITAGTLAQINASDSGSHTTGRLSIQKETVEGSSKLTALIEARNGDKICDVKLIADTQPYVTAPVRTNMGQNDVVTKKALDSAVQWGKITGTVSAQSDLMSAINNAVSLESSQRSREDQRLDTEILLTRSSIKDAKITIKQGGTEKGSFTVNQSSDATINLDSGGGDTPSDAKITITQGGVEKGFFTLNQSGDKTIALEGGGGGGATWGSIGGTITNQTDLVDYLAAVVNGSLKVASDCEAETDDETRATKITYKPSEPITFDDIDEKLPKYAIEGEAEITISGLAFDALISAVLDGDAGYGIKSERILSNQQLGEFSESYSLSSQGLSFLKTSIPDNDAERLTLTARKLTVEVEGDRNVYDLIDKVSENVILKPEYVEAGDGITIEGREESGTQLPGIKINAEVTTEDLSDEADTRAAEDSAIWTGINGEAATRQTNDEALGDRIDGEATTRQTNDEALGDRIDGEATTRQTNDEALGDRINGLSSEIDDIAGEVAALDADKQDVLVSGTNIKTINGNSVLGSGNLVVSGGTTRTITNIQPSSTSDIEDIILNQLDIGDEALISLIATETISSNYYTLINVRLIKDDNLSCIASGLFGVQNVNYIMTAISVNILPGHVGLDIQYLNNTTRSTQKIDTDTTLDISSPITLIKYS